MRILIADDNEMVRRGVIAILWPETRWEICGEAKNGLEALQKGHELLPNFILLDISMPGMNGLEAARLILREVPETKIIIMSRHDPRKMLPSVVAAGAHGCVDKSRLSTDLVASIKSVEKEI